MFCKNILGGTITIIAIFNSICHFPYFLSNEIHVQWHVMLQISIKCNSMFSKPITCVLHLKWMWTCTQNNKQIINIVVFW
jgi:hypothetical protein